LAGLRIKKIEGDYYQGKLEQIIIISEKHTHREGGVSNPNYNDIEKNAWCNLYKKKYKNNYKQNGDEIVAQKGYIEITITDNDYTDCASKEFNLDVNCALNELRNELDKIDYLSAKLYLAGSLYDCFGDKASKEILEQGMLSDNIYVNKETMQILLNIDLKKAQDLLPAVHKHIELYGKLKSHAEVENFMNVVLLRLEKKEYSFF
jgi:hypothetical protein